MGISNVSKRINTMNSSTTVSTLTPNGSKMKPNLIHLTFPSLFSSRCELYDFGGGEGKL